MLRKRHPTLAILTVMVLLGFTVADLTGDLLGAAVCAADADQADPASGATSQSLNSHKGQEDDARPAHIDDCFCCSRCVASAPRFTLRGGLRYLQPVATDAARGISHLSFELYRPPRTS